MNSYARLFRNIGVPLCIIVMLFSLISLRNLLHIVGSEWIPVNAIIKEYSSKKGTLGIKASKVHYKPKLVCAYIYAEKELEVSFSKFDFVSMKNRDLAVQWLKERYSSPLTGYVRLGDEADFYPYDPLEDTKLYYGILLFGIIFISVFILLWMRMCAK